MNAATIDFIGEAPLLAVARSATLKKSTATEPRPAESDGDDFEDRRRVLAALAECGGNQSRAAKQLRMSRGALIRRLTPYGVTRPREPD